MVIQNSTIKKKKKKTKIVEVPIHFFHNCTNLCKNNIFKKLKVFKNNEKGQFNGSLSV